MMDTKFEEGAVCFANGKQWHFNDSVKPYKLVNNMQGTRLESLVGVSTMSDFQLNTIKQGDRIEASELDTKQKYNDVVEVFELFGFKPHGNHGGYSVLMDYWEAIEVYKGKLVSTNSIAGRRLTYQQIMAIGELKRLDIERKKKKKGEGSLEEITPSIGDTISLRYKYDSKQIIHTGKILYLSKGHIMLLKEDHDVHLHRCEWIIEKPKTPEEVTRERVEKRLKDIIFSNTTPSSVAMILEEFNITEKDV